MSEEFMMDLNDEQLDAVVGGKHNKKKNNKKKAAAPASGVSVTTVAHTGVNGIAWAGSYGGVIDNGQGGQSQWGFGLSIEA